MITYDVIHKVLMIKIKKIHKCSKLIKYFDWPINQAQASQSSILGQRQRTIGTVGKVSSQTQAQESEVIGWR